VFLKGSAVGTRHSLNITGLKRISGSQRHGYEEFYPVIRSAVHSVANPKTFRRNISPLSSGSKNKPSKKQLAKRLMNKNIWTKSKR
jgi:hypothetical protein